MKKFFAKIHLWLSIPFGIIIAIVCLTGAILVFEAEILEFCYPSRYFVKEIKSGYEQAGLHEEAPFQDIQIVSKTDSGYVTKIQAGNVIMSGTEFAKILGLSSAAMTIENSNGKIKITTKGLGDGMGVSLYTADFMAKQGSSYEQILKAFYSGITIVSQ